MVTTARSKQRKSKKPAAKRSKPVNPIAKLTASMTEKGLPEVDSTVQKMFAKGLSTYWMAHSDLEFDTEENYLPSTYDGRAIRRLCTLLDESHISRREIAKAIAAKSFDEAIKLAKPLQSVWDAAESYLDADPLEDAWTVHSFHCAIKANVRLVNELLMSLPVELGAREFLIYLPLERPQVA